MMRNFAESTNQIAFVETQRFLHWRSWTRHKTGKMLTTIFALVSEHFRFADCPGLPTPRLRFSQVVSATSQTTHRHASECSSVLKDCSHCATLPLGMQDSFDYMSHFGYTVQSMYCCHRSV